MNAVSMLVSPKAQASPGLAKAQGSREEQAAFSPALMLLLAAGLVPTPLVPTLAVTPDAEGATNDAGTRNPLEGGDAALNANTGNQAGTGLNLGAPVLELAPPTPGAVPVANFKVVAPTPAVLLDTSASLAGGAATAATPEVATPSTSAAQVAKAANAQAAAAALAAEQATSLGSNLHVESRDIASRDSRPVPTAALPMTGANGKPSIAASVKEAASLAASQLAAIDAAARSQAAPATIAAAALTGRLGLANPRATDLAPSEPTIKLTGETVSTAPSVEQSASGEAVLDSARRAAAVANHPMQQLKRSITPLKQAETATPEQAVAGARGKQGPARQAPANFAAAVQQAPPTGPGVPVGPREVTPPLVANDGFTARSTQEVPQDPRLDSIDGGRNALSRPDQVTLRVEGESGEEARLRVAVRGRDVRATIATDDPSLARRLEEGLGSLRNALGDRGFDKSQVLVQGAAVRAGEGAQEAPRDPLPKKQQQNPDGAPKNGKQPETPEQRSRSRNGRNTEGR